jgi:hypothetical protein
MIAQACNVRFLLTSLSFLCCVALPLSKVQAEEKKEAFYAQVIRGVVPLYHHIFVRNQGEDKERRTTNRDGTGFFVHTPDSLFIVTAAHVARPNHDLHALVPLKPEGEQQAKVWKLRLPRSEWVFHPIKGTSTTREVDVAVMKIGLAAAAVSKPTVA